MIILTTVISDEGSLYESIRYCRRYNGMHLTFKRSIWTELPFEEIHTLVSAANKFHSLVRIDE